MVDTFQPRSLSCFRNRKRRHDNEMNLEKEKGPRVLQHHMGWNVQRTFPLLPVAGEIFLLTFPLIERGNRVRREKAVVHSGGTPARELVRSTR